MNKYLLASIANIIVGLSSSASAQTIIDHSFENTVGSKELNVLSTELDSNSNGTENATSLGWTFSANAGLMRGVTSDGQQAGWLNPQTDKGGGVTSSISQVVSFANAGSYNLNYDSFAQEWGFERLSQFNVTVTSVLTGGNVLDVDTYENATDGQWTNRVHGFDTLAGDYRVSFNATGTSPFLSAVAGDIFIDNVSVTPVPEPTGVVLLGLGSAAFLLRRKRA